MEDPFEIYRKEWSAKLESAVASAMTLHRATVLLAAHTRLNADTNSTMRGTDNSLSTQSVDSHPSDPCSEGDTILHGTGGVGDGLTLCDSANGSQKFTQGSDHSQEQDTYGGMFNAGSSDNPTLYDSVDDNQEPNPGSDYPQERGSDSSLDIAKIDSDATNPCTESGTFLDSTREFENDVTLRGIAKGGQDPPDPIGTHDFTQTRMENAMFSYMTTGFNDAYCLFDKKDPGTGLQKLSQCKRRGTVAGGLRKY